MTCMPAQPPQRYLLGNAVTIRARLLDTEGDVVDPANLQLLVAGPDDVASTTYAVTADGDDAVASFTPDRSGTWRYRVETFQGSVSAALERFVVILPTAMP